MGNIENYAIKHRAPMYNDQQKANTLLECMAKRK